MNFLNLICAHARAVVITIFSLPSILSKAWADEKAKRPKNADGTAKSCSQQFSELKADAQQQRDKRLAHRKRA